MLLLFFPQAGQQSQATKTPITSFYWSGRMFRAYTSSVLSNDACVTMLPGLFTDVGSHVARDSFVINVNGADRLYRKNKSRVADTDPGYVRVPGLFT